MNQDQKREYLIRNLLQETPSYRKTQIPADTESQQQLLRSLMNIRLPKEISREFARIQDEYLQERNAERGIVYLDDLTPVHPDLYLWNGDITTLAVDAIVNAANSGMTGCYRPCHACIDNCIHTYAGIQLRNFCDDLIRRQGHEEYTGMAKITPGFNLPCRFIIHTVGPIIRGEVTADDENDLVSCYRSCLSIAEENDVQSIAFCCISTGVFGFPKGRAAELAVRTVKQYKEENNSKMKVIFNVHNKIDMEIYSGLLL